jgi:glycosyltransferase involved in cell wall biosynthesis
MKLSIIVPVYNEEETIEEVVKKLFCLEIEKEIIIINDGSTDRTKKFLDKYKVNEAFKIIHLKSNRGKGNAIRIGIKEARGEVISIQDADLEYEPKELIKLIEPIKEDKADVVYGIRFSKNNIKGPLWHKLVNKFLTFITNFFYFSSLSDMETCYKIMRTPIWRKLNLESNRFEIEAEITAKILKKGYKIFEIPIIYHKRSYREGKKIGLRDGILTIWALLKYRLVS